jgi:hypothetical protein
MVDVASLGLFKIDRSTQKLTTGRIHYSMFDVERSVFDVHQFLFRFDWKLAAGGGAGPGTAHFRSQTRQAPLTGNPER